MPADPMLNERAILATLRNDAMQLSVDGWRAFCEVILMACFDRKVTREFFAEMLDLTSETQDAIGELEGIGRMMRLLAVTEPTQSSAMLKEEAEKFSKLFAHHRRRIAEKFALLVQCPTTADPIH